MGAVVDQSVAALGRYEIERELSRGGMGVVYRALDRVLGRPVALKRSLGERDGSFDLHRTMLQREYQTLVTLRHPHIIEVFDFDSDELGPYYTMELLDGTDLRANCPLPWREVCKYLRDIASSLALLNMRRLLHCDVSVANIRLTSGGRAKLLDFGALASFGRNVIVAGAPPTTAPEALAGLDLDARVDLYALGATAYYALTGCHAYPATMLSLLQIVWAQGLPKAPSQYVAEIPQELDELVLSLLELDRAQRPASAAEVMDRLGAIAGLPPEQDPQVARSYLFSAGIIGRDSERRALTNRLSQAFYGHGSGVLISGAPGLGKSLLLEELLQKARVAGAQVQVVNGRAHPDAFAAWSVEESDTSGNDVSMPPSDNDASIRRSDVRVLAIEDLHEAGNESLALLASLAKSVRRRPVLFVTTLDPAHANAERPALRLLRERLHCVELRPFDEAAALRLVKGLFGEVAAAARLSSFLHDHAAGNPRACTEIVAHLIERGSIRSIAWRRAAFRSCIARSVLRSPPGSPPGSAGRSGSPSACSSPGAGVCSANPTS